jgi:aryl-alcohol dehydrogenase-like predicted oxidoreductase
MCTGPDGELHNDSLPGEHAHELALRFTLGSPVHTAIVGTRNPSHLLRNVENAAAGTLPSYQFEEIRARWKEVATANWVGQT